MIRFASPLFLLGLLLIPLLYWIEKTRKKGFVFYSAFSLFHTSQNQKKSFLWVPLFLRLLTITLVMIALARPQLANMKTEVMSEGVDIMLTLDTSGSMQALDFKIGGQEVDRLTVVKQVVADFIKHRVSDRIGMVVFGEMAYTQVPQTLDYDVLLSFLNQLQIGAAGDGTAIGDALALSVKRLKDLPSKSKIIILLTDGRSNAGKITAEKAAEIAATYGIKVYTIGVGTRGLVPFPEQTFFGTRQIMVKLDIDEETLEKIAQTTGGKFFQASDTEGLQQIYQTIDKLEKSQAKVKYFQEYHELFRYFLLPAFLLFLSEIFLRNTWMRRFP
ncbi:MAG: VWA domain-containing protein [Deltaproteobacteria bacterium]|nr:VWA domain-containing protein [Deltaproteobacteria bacterium]